MSTTKPKKRLSPLEEKIIAELAEQSESRPKSRRDAMARHLARTGDLPHQPSSASLVKSLRATAEGILNPTLARSLMLEAAHEIERLQQLPLL